MVNREDECGGRPEDDRLTMALPLKYNFRNLFVRWRTTIATVLGIALVVAVYVLITSLAIGLKKAAQNTGDPRNLLVVRRGSTAESTSQITVEEFNILKYSPQIQRDADGKPLLSSDLIVVINVPRADQGEANVTARGVSHAGKALRPQVNLVAGRWFDPGKREIVVSRRLATRFVNMNLGDVIKTGPARLKVVGWFDGDRSAFDSEIWMDADEARRVFDRDNYSSLLVRPVDESAGEAFKNTVENDKRFKLRVLPETEYYTEQTNTALPIRVLGTFLATTMSIGAVFSAMNAMYAVVAARTREVGTLRVLGFRRREILIGFLIEGVLLALIGGVIGVILSLPINGWTTGTISFDTFSETIFEFRITPDLALQGLVFAFAIGVLGSLFPAVRASRTPVISALKAV
jgi:putative ABC transport system permease protein